MSDLETLVRRSGADLHLDRPYAAVAARGRDLRRRRRGAAWLATGVVTTAVGLVGMAQLSSDPRPPHVLIGKPAGRSVLLSGGELRTADRWCRSHPIARAPAGFDHLRVVAAGDTSVGRFLLYSNGQMYLRCLVADREGTGGGGGGPVGPTPGPGRELVSSSYTFSSHGGQITALLAYGRVSSDVARVTGTVPGDQVEAVVGNGWYWLSTRFAGDDGSPPRLDLRAYDAQGRLLTLVTTRG